MSGDRSRIGACEFLAHSGSRGLLDHAAQPLTLVMHAACIRALPARKSCLPSPGEGLSSSQHNQSIEGLVGFGFFFIYWFCFNCYISSSDDSSSPPRVTWLIVLYNLCITWRVNGCGISFIVHTLFESLLCIMPLMWNYRPAEEQLFLYTLCLYKIHI